MEDLTLISSVITIIALAIKSYFNERKKRSLTLENNQLTEEKNKLSVELSSVGIVFNYKMLTTIEEAVVEIFNNTKAKKFLILFAVNGKTSFRNVTRCFERNKSSRSPYLIRKFRRIEVDEEYKDLLRYIELNNHVIINTADIPESVLKQMHSSYKQNTTHLIKGFLRRISLDEDNDLLLYVSVSTDEEEAFDNDEKFVILNAIHTIKNHAEEIEIDDE